MRKSNESVTINNAMVEAISAAVTTAIVNALAATATAEIKPETTGKAKAAKELAAKKVKKAKK